jgi:hypothetical protein
MIDTLSEEERENLSTFEKFVAVKLVSIEAQVLKTNGRVTALEGTENQRKGGISWAKTWVVPILLILFTWLLNRH